MIWGKKRGRGENHDSLSLIQAASGPNGGIGGSSSVSFLGRPLGRGIAVAFLFLLTTKLPGGADGPGAGSSTDGPGFATGQHELK